MVREPELALLPAGKFVMGDPNGNLDEKPTHTVTIGRPFYMSTTLVTRGEYSQCVKARKCAAADVPPFVQTDNDPVVGVSWDDAQTYVTWLRQTTGKPYRLPSEAEWEYAARAGTRTARYWGDWGDDFVDGRDTVPRDRKRRVLGEDRQNMASHIM